MLIINKLSTLYYKALMPSMQGTEINIFIVVHRFICELFAIYLRLTNRCDISRIKTIASISCV